MIDILKEGQDSPLDINESSFGMKNKEDLKRKLNETEESHVLINQNLNTKNRVSLEISQKHDRQLYSLKPKNPRGIIRGRGGRPLLTKLRKQYTSIDSLGNIRNFIFFFFWYNNRFCHISFFYIVYIINVFF